MEDVGRSEEIKIYGSVEVAVRFLSRIRKIATEQKKPMPAFTQFPLFDLIRIGEVSFCPWTEDGWGIRRVVEFGYQGGRIAVQVSLIGHISSGVLFGSLHEIANQTAFENPGIRWWVSSVRYAVRLDQRQKDFIFMDAEESMYPVKEQNSAMFEQV